MEPVSTDHMNWERVSPMRPSSVGRPRGCGVDTRKAMGCVPPGRTESPRMRGRTVVLWPGHEGCPVECISHPGSNGKQRDWGLSRVATISHHS